MSYFRLLAHLLMSAVMMLVVAPVPLRAAPTNPIADQAAAMHSTARADVAGRPTTSLYQIVGTVDPSARTWQATQTLTVTNQSGTPLTSLYFRLFANLADVGGSLVIQSASVNGTSIPVKYTAGRYIARLDLTTPIAVNAQASVVLNFVTTAPNNGGEDVYGMLNADGQTLALAMSYPLLAMYNNGVWDTTVPDTTGDIVTSPVAFYDVTITAPRTHTVVSTGTAISTRISGTTQTVRIVSGLQRDFALAVTTLAKLSATVDGTKLNVYYPNGKRQAGQAALTYASQALHFFNTTYGQYPYNELDLITVNAGTFEGLELPSFILFEQQLYNTSSDFESLVVHEVAHQWFYGVIGNDVQNHAWVDEGLASYSQVLYQESLHGARAGANEKRIFADDYAELQNQNQDGAMDRPISTMSDYQYGVLSYSKAALYIDAIRTTISPKLFVAAMRSYYTTNRYGIVDGSALVTAVQRVCACDIQPLYTQWVLAR